MSTPPTTSPMFTSTLETPTVDWVDVLGHFLEGADEHHQQNKSGVQAEAQSGRELTSDASPIPALSNAINKPVNNSVATTEQPSASDSENLEEPEDEKLSAAQKARIRSERKRSREKQRRSDVNTQFSDLTALLKKIEAEDVQNDESRQAFMELTTSSNNMNRVDLIGKTISVLGRIHNDNRKRRLAIEELTEELKVTKKRADEATGKLQLQQAQPSQNKKSDPVMMMVPMMVRPDGTSQSPFMPQSMPYYPMCPPAGADKTSGTVPPNYGGMFNPFMFGKQFSSESQPSAAASSGMPSETLSPNPQQFMQMVPMQVAENSENLAHCA